MNLIHLPEDIIRIILQYLDTKSIQSLYETSGQLRGIMSNGSVKKCKMSKSTLATARFLKTNFFKDISPFIQELDMSTVPDLSKSTFLAAMKHLRALKNLNVSYTSLKLEHLADLTGTCPELKTLCANFDFIDQKSKQSLSKIQNFFAKLQNIHLVVSINCILYSTLTFIILKKAKLKSLKFTISHTGVGDIVFPENNVQCKVPDFDQFNIYFLEWLYPVSWFGEIRDIPILALLELNLFEFIMIVSTKLIISRVLVSNLFVNFFSKYFDLDACCITDISCLCIPGNLAVMLWKKDATKFDDIFFDNLFNDLKQFFPFCIKGDELTVPSMQDWFIVEPKITEADDKEDTNGEPKIKTRRLGVRKKTLDYDQLFSNKEKIKLSFDINYLIPYVVTLPPASNYLLKITYLSLSGSPKLSSDFFNIVFRSCKVLQTLNVETPSLSNCSQLISGSLSISCSLRNFRLVTKGINFNAMFTALSRCRAIENIFICEHLKHIDGNPKAFIDPSQLFKKCDNLYNLYLDFPTTKTSYNTYWRPTICKALTKYNRQFLNVTLCPKLCKRDVSNFLLGYNPFIEVFRLNTIKDIL
ncbi:hypothetical protein K1T71_001852 [Dendrolimus kikuchii]|uniref:Uncharacterized protein n=1 Tax=Dendrolimus kikuchii TaxID=765133 RepID=A0ACC1DEV0_9NEOP|nr:hypothetical protein K1T71_001852 [Dendrolimus kikuchii]